jgi:hypothetical protein
MRAIIGTEHLFQLKRHGMALLLKDCGLEGFKGSVQRCGECERQTVHFRRTGGWPVCGVCGAVTLRLQVVTPPARAEVIPLPLSALRRTG